tara:strand:+ start:179 stop:658 length:480 start_codon:yes stop_codon:yes gene_type:complete
MSNKFILAVARAPQIEDICKLAVKAFQEGPEDSSHLSLAKVRGVVASIVKDSHQLSVVAMVEGKPKGLILGHVDEHAYCDGLVASDLCIYVAPSLRGTDAAKDLVKVYADWCGRIPNLIGSTLGVSKINHTTPYMEKLFRDNGYSKSGLTYIKTGHSNV